MINDDPWAARREELCVLLARVAGGDRSAFDRVYEIASPHLYASLVRICRRAAWADEILQECFVSVWQHAARFDPERASPMTWMGAIARNAALDRLRRKDSHEGELDEAATEAIPSSEPEPLQALMDGAEVMRVRDCLGALPAAQRQTLALAFYDGLSHSEVAAHVNEPLGTVKSWIRRGLAALKSCLDA